MANVNKVLLIGRLTRDPETRFLPSGAGVVNFGLATNRTWKDNGGEKQEEVTFVDVEAWGRLGEVVQKYLEKGRAVFLEGRLRFSQWEAQDGGKRSKLSVVAENVQFLDGGGEKTSEGRSPEGPGDCDDECPI